MNSTGSMSYFLPNTITYLYLFIILFNLFAQLSFDDILLDWFQRYNFKQMEFELLEI